MSTEQTTLPASRNWKNVFSRLCGWLSGLLLIGFVVSFWTRWDLLNLPTIVPVFLWLGLGLILSVLVRHSSIVNNFPVQRIDAIWISSQLKGVSVESMKSKHSDHRAVISDLRID